MGGRPTTKKLLPFSAPPRLCARFSSPLCGFAPLRETLPTAKGFRRFSQRRSARRGRFSMGGSPPLQNLCGSAPLREVSSLLRLAQGTPRIFGDSRAEARRRRGGSAWGGGLHGNGCGPSQRVNETQMRPRCCDLSTEITPFSGKRFPASAPLCTLTSNV